MSSVKKLSWVNQYWQIINILLFSLRTVGHIVCVLVVVAITMLFCWIIFPSAGFFIQPFAFLILFILAFVGCIALPMGMVVLVSNKHISAMADLRKKLFIIVCSFCLTLSLLFSFSLSVQNPTLVLSNFIAFAFLFCALLVWGSVFLGGKRIEFSFITPLIMVGVVRLLFEHVMAWHPLLILAVGVLVWLLFYRWWLVFSPNKRRATSTVIESNARALQGVPIERLIFFPAGRVRTAIGSLLLGYGDGFLSQFIRIALIYICVLAFSFFVCSGINAKGFTDTAFTATLVTLVYAFLLLAIDMGVKPMLRNSRRGWLVFDGDRKAIFHYIERKYLRSLAFLALLNLVFIVLLLWISHREQYFFYCMGALLGVSVCVICAFYSDICFYRRGVFALDNINWRQVAVNFMCLVPLICYLVSKYHEFNIFDVKDAVAISLLLLIVACLRNIRARALKRWQAADL